MSENRYTRIRDGITERCGKIISGKDNVIRLVLTSFLCGGHVLVEDLPGTGKTMLLRAFASAIGGSFGRIQFTPDLLPSDITGIHFFQRRSDEFVFRPGPIFGNVILADEINRATPRTQSALLEAMEERQVTVDGKTFCLPDPFMVMATQNPVDSYGTFPLPEAQMDRFFMRLSMGYMKREEERVVMARPSTIALLDSMPEPVPAEDLRWAREHYVETRVSDAVKDYIMDIIEATRSSGIFTAGVSTRGAIALYKAAQATAALDGREFVLPEDVKACTVSVLAHRITSPADTDEKAGWLDKLLDTLPVPTEVC